MAAHEQLARYGQSGSGSTTVPDFDEPLPLGDVRGTIGGTAFTLHNTLQIPSTLTPDTDQVISLGAVTATHRGEPVKATLSAPSTAQNRDFKGPSGRTRSPV